MKKSSKHAWLERIVSILCVVLMVASVLFVNNSSTSAYAAEEETQLQSQTSSESSVTSASSASTSESIQSSSQEQSQTESENAESSESTENTESTEAQSSESTESTVSYSYEISDKGILVQAQAPNGSLPEGASLQVLAIEENTQQYEEVGEKLQEKIEEENYSLAGFLAYDISFIDANGNEVEPSSGSVKVSFSYTEKAIPEEVKNSSNAQNAEIKVLHLVEDESGNVTDVVDLTQQGTASVSASSEKEVESLSFETDSFSTVAIPWVMAAADTDSSTAVQPIASTEVDYSLNVEYKKTIQKLENPEQYKLALDVTGIVRKPENADILLIVDKSGSMKSAMIDDSSTTRTEALNKAVKTMVDQIAAYKKLWRTEDQPDINVSVVEFSSGVSNGTRSDSASQNENNSKPSASIAEGWTQLTDDYKYEMSDPTGGTNWQAGILRANELMQEKANDGHKKYVIFLTDGLPTFRYASGQTAVESGYDSGTSGTHKIYGTGSENYTIETNYGAALAQWKASTYLQSSNLYVVNAGGSTATGNKCDQFVTDTAGYYKTGQAVSAGDSEKLSVVFTQLAADIMYGSHMSDVSIHDTLSDNVDFAAGTDAATIAKNVKAYMVTSDGTETEMDSANYTVTVDVEKKSVDVAFKIDEVNYLEDDVTYRIKFDVVVKTQTAIDQLIVTPGYPNTGDETTDAPGNETSANKGGLWSNDEQNTYLRYTVPNRSFVYEETTVNYKRPVAQIDTVSHTAKKVWEGSEDITTHDAVTAVLKATVKVDAQGNAQTDERDVSSEIFVGQLANAAEQSLSVDNSWEYTWNYLPKYYHCRDANGNDVAAEITYTVSEKETPSGYTSKVESSVDSSDSSHTISTITNTEIPTVLDLKKTNYEGSTELSGAVFALDRKVTGSDGSITWNKVKDIEVSNTGAAELTDLETGSYRLYETTAPEGYTVLDGYIYFDVNLGTITIQTESDSVKQIMLTLEEPKAQADEEDTGYTLTIKNSPIYSLHQSGGFGIYPFTIGGVAIIATALLLFIKNRQKEGR